jgi:dihydroorotate dehydrogenase electron transfer subunit
VRTMPRGPFDAVVLANREASPTSRVIVLARPAGFEDARPGQFVSIRAREGTAPLLRRPYSIMDLTAKSLTLLVKAVGAGSAASAARRRGETVDLIGPLGGSSFPDPPPGEAVLVAGGTGLAPLVFAARTWRRRRLGTRVRMLYGAATRGELLRDLVRKDFANRAFATLDGSAGFRGDVVALCRGFAGKARSRGTLYSCGPRGMVRALASAVDGCFEAHYTSLESVMACGVGACRGCTVPVRADGGTALKTVCSDGTVFRAEEIAWEEWEE